MTEKLTEKLEGPYREAAVFEATKRIVFDGIPVFVSFLTTEGGDLMNPVEVEARVVFAYTKADGLTVKSVEGTASRNPGTTSAGPTFGDTGPECNEVRRSKGLPYPRFCFVCGLGPCRTGAKNIPNRGNAGGFDG